MDNRNSYLNRSRKYASNVGQKIQADPFRYALYIFLAAVTLFMLYNIIYYVYYKVSGKSIPVYGNGKQIVGEPKDAYKGKIVNKRVEIPNPTEGLTYTYSFWFYIQDWSYRTGKYKNIFVKGGGNNPTPGVWLDKDTNTLHTRIKTNDTSVEYETCDVKNIPLQKWNHVAYVLNNRAVDIYVNGKLERSCVLNGIPVLNSNKLHVAKNDGFYGKLGNLIYYTRALEPSDISQIYKAGPYA